MCRSSFQNIREALWLTTQRGRVQAASSRLSKNSVSFCDVSHDATKICTPIVFVCPKNCPERTFGIRAIVGIDVAEMPGEVQMVPNGLF